MYSGMQSHRGSTKMKLTNLLLLIFISACMHTPDNPSRWMVRKCTPVLEEILRVQDLRENLNTEIAQFTKQYQNEEIGKEEYRIGIQEWLGHENALRSYVTRLYNEAYQARCL